MNVSVTESMGRKECKVEAVLKAQCKRVVVVRW